MRLLMALTLAASLLGALSPSAWARQLGFSPDAWQDTFLESDAPRQLLNVTRQGGKSTATAYKIGHGVVHGEDGYTAVLTAPSERQSTELMRKVRAVLTKAVPADQVVREGETYIELTRGRRAMAFPAKESTVRGPTANLLVLDEAARVPDDLYRAVRPMLAVSGGSLVALSTPYGQRGFFYQEWTHGGPTWRRAHVTWRDCPRMSAEFIAEERASVARQGMDPDAWIAQEYEGSFAAAVQGSYYGRLLEEARAAGRIKDLPYDPQRGPVLTAWDLGVGDPTGIWFVQLVPPSVYVLAYREMAGAGLDHYAGLLRQMPYHQNYLEHAWPHDGAHRSLESGLPLQTAGEAVGIRPIRIIPRTPDLDQDITAVRALLPRCYFDARECQPGLEALAFYHTEYDEDRKTFKPKPEHDWSSHAADAFRTLALAVKTAVATGVRRQVWGDPGDDPYAWRPADGRPRQLYAES